MARVKRGVTSHAKHKKVLKAAKGCYGRRKNTIRIAKQAVEKAMQYAYRDRKNRKRTFRALWIQRINAAVREHGLTYSRLIDNGGERFRLADGDVGQDLAVDLDPGLAEAVDKSGIGQAVLAHRRVEALDPQRPEGALPVLAVAVGILKGLVDRRLGGADRVLAPAVIALGGVQNFLVFGVARHAAFHAGHG